MAEDQFIYKWRVANSLAFALAGLLPFLLRETFDRYFAVFAILLTIQISYCAGDMEMHSIKPAYYNGVIQILVIATLARLGWISAGLTMFTPVIVYGIATEHSQATDIYLQLYLFSTLGFAANRVIDWIQISRIQQTHNDAVIQWTRKMAHELRMPLINIKLKSHQLLRMGGANSNPADPFLVEIQGIIELCERSLKLQERILTNARAGQLRIQNPRLIQAAEMVQSALDSFPYKQKDDSRRIELILQSDFCFSGDPLLFENVIHNLVANAMQAIHTKEVGEIKIKISHTRKTGTILIRDTAGLLDQNSARNIFKAGVSFNKYSGSGFGLAYSKSVLKLHGGSITCKPAPDKHTDFILSLPIFADRE